MIPGEAAFLRRTLIVLAVAVATIAAWRLREVELLLFGSILTAVALSRMARPVERHTPLAAGPALAAVAVGLVLLLALMGAFFGWRMQAQVSEASALLPKAYRLFLASVRTNPLGNQLLDAMSRINATQALPVLRRLPIYAISALTVVGELLAVLVGGIYLAAQPGLYRGGLLRLLPDGSRRWTDGLLEEAGEALRKWLLAQLVAMVSVGLLVGVGMWIIGVPTPMALGLFAGLAEFVPVVGPIVSAVPALLLALLHGFDKALWTLGLFCLVQQFEGHVILPLVQRKFAALPPVVTLFAILSFAVIFGPLGVLLGIPMTVVTVVAVKRLRFRGKPSAEDAASPPVL